MSKMEPIPYSDFEIIHNPNNNGGNFDVVETGSNLKVVESPEIREKNYNVTGHYFFEGRVVENPNPETRTYSAKNKDGARTIALNDGLSRLLNISEVLR